MPTPARDVRPWQHAISSSRKSGRLWTEDLEIHEFLDISKASCADRRHRMVLHHVDLGAAVAEMAFPNRIDVQAVVQRHVIEDLGAPCTLADWFSGCDMDALPRPLARRLDAGKEGIVDLVAARLHPACRSAVEQVYDILFLPARYVPDERALCILMNASGPGIVRRIFGAPERQDVEGQQVFIDRAWTAEAITFAMYGRIAELSEIVTCCMSEPGEHSNAG